MASHIGRRKFLAALAAQQPERMRRIGVLTAFAENDAEAQANITAFRQSLI
jgi:hypothetical protein